ncbi:hypothetical protein BB559_002760 [Furculomyces boomerangus]|uniref:Uncharacterized protein n=1 Tax=Furculomyces boomerangus TaxID=61424 RepID=A0A2T9YST0_9FUNG|nr:hypothetical protein BB559_002760 [Furculomyces boomerangus]
MSKNKGNSQQENVPAWAQQILFRISKLETQQLGSVPTPSVVIMILKITLTNTLLKGPHKNTSCLSRTSPSITQYHKQLFQVPTVRYHPKKVYGICPKNEANVYKPPTLDEFGLLTIAKNGNSRLTSTIDYFAHTILKGDRDALFAENSIEFASAIRILLAELSMHITQHRMDNAFKHARISGKVPQILPTSYNTLFDPTELVEHVSLSKLSKKQQHHPVQPANEVFTQEEVLSQNNTQRERTPTPHKTPQYPKHTTQTYLGKKLVIPLGVRIARIFAAALLASGGGEQGPSRGLVRSLLKSVGETNQQQLGKNGHRDGFKIPLLTRHKITTCRRLNLGKHKMSKEDTRLIEGEIMALLLKNAIEEVSQNSQDFFRGCLQYRKNQEKLAQFYI